MIGVTSPSVVSPEPTATQADALTQETPDNPPPAYPSPLPAEVPSATRFGLGTTDHVAPSDFSTSVSWVPSRPPNTWDPTVKQSVADGHETPSRAASSDVTGTARCVHPVPSHEREMGGPISEGSAGVAVPTAMHDDGDGHDTEPRPPATAGVATRVHEDPSNCSTSTSWAGVVPSPTATHHVVDAHDTPSNQPEVFVAVLVDHDVGATATDQVEPFHVSTSGCNGDPTGGHEASSPVATQNVALGQEIPPFSHV